ncbi:hypothetical protein CIB84_013097 [Bambusicola thoracicus]|uniref:Baculoviral IAP repeat-containing protein 5.1 n=1 Tax=Bambusicola thoracicus TaxID=9083 RepID=A0A2P4SGB0_BAMTH|nr:hypothetical protein CIB84_013097 [Bambusicola thoracicus]
MEVLLKDLVSSSKLLSDFKEMYDYENRLKTFTNWPFVENCKCTPENVSLNMDASILSYFWYTVTKCKVPHVSMCTLKISCEPLLGLSFKLLNCLLQMAKAGFIHCPSANETDVAKCFFCLIELEGWEPNDDPWEEHTKRRSCGFLSLTKQFDDLTMEEYYMLEMTRLRTFLCKTGRSIINSFEEEVAATRKRLVDNFVSNHQYTPQPPVPIQADPTCPPSESS